MNEKQLQIVNFEQAHKLRELGFDWNTEYLYLPSGKLVWFQENSNHEPYPDNWNAGGDEFVSAPSVALALKWVRDMKDYVLEIHHNNGYFGKLYNVFGAKEIILNTKILNTYEAAESSLLDELLTLIENQP